MQSDVGKMLGFEDNGQEKIIETSSMQKGSFIKTQGQGPWVERAAVGWWEVAFCILSGWEGVGIAQASNVVWKYGFQDLEGASYC